MKEHIYANAPHFVQNCIISIYNYLAYKKRHSVKYKHFLNHFKQNAHLSFEELKNIQINKYKDFIEYAQNQSSFYNKQFKSIVNPEDINNITKLPIIDKETLRKNIKAVYTIPKNKGEVSRTGGTTGKSLEVLFTFEDLEERFALLDNFRGNFGYQLGDKTAWFSGKSLISSRDLKRNRFWKTDYFYNVRYYSTFHIHNNYLGYYLNNLITYKPKYLVGFPSTMYEIAKYGMLNNIEFPNNTIKAIFPTAETITDDIRNVLEGFFKTNLYNQYASSEGAPFIFECKNKKLHLELQSGVFEVLDENNNISNTGRLIVTAFNTHGTPLIRYDIGDTIALSEDTCNCGNNNPLVKEISGRISDFIYSEEMGKVNLGNISNCLKGVKGIIKFQIIQKIPDKLIVLITKDLQIYDDKNEAVFLKNLKARVGIKMEIEINYVNNIEVEKSGKFRILKNLLDK